LPAAGRGGRLDEGPVARLQQPVPAGIHDILTGSNEDGTLAPGATCRAWTSPASADATMVGHFDKRGDARFYCFAAD
jgi:hypothetical protein